MISAKLTSDSKVEQTREMDIRVLCASWVGQNPKMLCQVVENLENLEFSQMISAKLTSDSKVE
jgi:hypothetical protein